MQKKLRNEKGFASAVTLLLAAVLAVLSYKIIMIARIAINVAKEKQSLDACAMYAGLNILKTNDTENICHARFFDECVSHLEIVNINGQMQCIDEGLVCNNLNECKRVIKVSSTYNPGIRNVTKSVDVHINEEEHNVDLIDAAVILLLDYSGSMSGNRIQQLKNTVNQFISSNFNLSYSVILYNSDIISSTEIGKSIQHDNTAASIVNNNNPNGGTNFIKPLNKALQQISSTNYEAYYILLISDGSPNEGINSSQSLVQNNIMNISDENCIYTTNSNPCTTIYTLGVDNANTEALRSISGNTLSSASNDFSFVVNANQVTAAFNAIIKEIMCRIGPVIGGEGLNVFNNLEILEKDIDYLYDSVYKIIKFYDVEPFNICTEMLGNNANITLRWGKPKLYVE
jgi:uncharacterized protein YegL